LDFKIKESSVITTTHQLSREVFEDWFLIIIRLKEDAHTLKNKEQRFNIM